jgi:hypothetical protein
MDAHRLRIPGSANNRAGGTVACKVAALPGRALSLQCFLARPCSAVQPGLRRLLPPRRFFAAGPRVSKTRAAIFHRRSEPDRIPGASRIVRWSFCSPLARGRKFKREARAGLRAGDSTLYRRRPSVFARHVRERRANFRHASPAGFGAATAELSIRKSLGAGTQSANRFR